jgi:hypothetical protein
MVLKRMGVPPALICFLLCAYILNKSSWFYVASGANLVVELKFEILAPPLY